MEEYDVTVVGASVIGSRVADLVSQRGYRVLLIEEHKQIGLPQHCTGLVSFRLLELLPDIPKQIIVNKIKSAKFFSPNGNCLELKPKYLAYVIDRIALDRFLFNKVKDNVKVKTGERFESFKYKRNSVEIKTNREIYHSKILVGADGVNSQVRKKSKIEYPKNFLLGLQSKVKGAFDPDNVELWFGSKICPKFFAWVVPENEDVARVGLATNSNTIQYYHNFLQKRLGYTNKPINSGLINYGIMKETSSNRLMLVGDASCQVKPFSGGGLIYGLIAAEICADACIDAIENDKFDEKFFKENYDKRWKKILFIPIIKGLILRNIFNILLDTDLNFLFYFLGHRKKFLENWDMDLF